MEHAEEFFRRTYHAANPFDVYDDFRDEACKLLKQFGINVEYHHHETGERGQHEIRLLILAEKYPLHDLPVMNRCTFRTECIV